MYKLGALLLLAWSVVATAQAQLATLTLTCKGTTTDGSDPNAKQPISMGIIVNFTDRTVQGIGDYPVMITAANDVIVVFGGHQQVLTSLSSISGNIDRVTGDVEAISMVSDPKTAKIIGRTTYALECRPCSAC
jgi:hypothetical protein